MSNSNNHCTIIAYGPSSETSSFHSAFEREIEGAGIHLYYGSLFFGAEGEDVTFISIDYSERDDKPFDVSPLIALFPKLRFLLWKQFESAYCQAKVVRHRHDKGFNCCLIDDKVIRTRFPDLDDLPLADAIADDLIEEVSNDPDLANAFSLVGYPLEVLESFANECSQRLASAQLAMVH